MSRVCRLLGDEVVAASTARSPRVGDATSSPRRSSYNRRGDVSGDTVPCGLSLSSVGKNSPVSSVGKNSPVSSFPPRRVESPPGVSATDNATSRTSTASLCIAPLAKKTCCRAARMWGDEEEVLSKTASSCSPGCAVDECAVVGSPAVADEATAWSPSTRPPTSGAQRFVVLSSTLLVVSSGSPRLAFQAIHSANRACFKDQPDHSAPALAYRYRTAKYTTWKPM